MKRGERWLLPDGVDEVIPPDVEPLEQLRRDVLDLFRSWGYELVVPPLVEFIESLQAGNGEDLDLQTFKITDQVSGRTMGVRADMTPQVARIDAHRLPTDLPQRLSYVGPVLHTRPDKFAGSRNPLQVGAELYGHEGIESDAEIVCLMADVLRCAGLFSVTIELGHMGLFKSLIELADLNVDAADKLLDALLRKDVADVTECLKENKVEAGARNLLLALLKLNGGIGVIARAKKALAGGPANVLEALDALKNLTDLLVDRIPAVDLHVDLAELRGYRYHTGVTFAAYMPGEGRQIAWGGRYDNIGREFGRHRAATGFSTDLKNLSSVRRTQSVAAVKVFAPADHDPALRNTVERLRNEGTIVVQELPGQVGDARAMRCTHVLKRAVAGWRTEPLND